MHRSFGFSLSLFLLLICNVCLAQSTAIKAGHLFDSRTGKVLNNQIILVKDGKIQQVGPDLKFGSEYNLIDLSNSWVLPGLMDCHVHITSNLQYRVASTADYYTTTSSTLRGLNGAFVARQLLEGGFTTIKEIGNDANYATADIIKAIHNGWAQGPTIYYAGKIIAPYGGQVGGINIENERLWQFEYIDADTPDEIKKAVRKNIYYGANVIKLVADQFPYFYNLEDVKAAVDEAKKANIKVTAHVMGGQAARNVIMGGAAAIEHGFDLDDELLKLMKDKGTFLVGTDFSFDNFYAYGMDSASAMYMENKLAKRLKNAYTIGTKIAFGTDIIIDLPGLNRLQTNLKVLQTWKKAGIPASYILQTMTIYSAELLGTEKSRGVIEAGFNADIIATDKNPTQDIDAIKEVKFVMKDGKIVR